MNDLLYLRPNVQIEPLVDQWYAWLHLIPPATMARHMTHRHFRIMESYVAAPHVHATAVKTPQMRGGPFVDYGGARAREIEELCERTRERRAPLVHLSRALEALDRLLADRADGTSLQPLYAEVPDALRGYVEMAYDLRHHACFRLLESLLYRSPLYDASAQSVMVSLTTKDERPFVMSTPRLQQDGMLHLDWRFDDPRVDALGRLLRTPKPWDWIRDAFDIGDSDAARWRTMLTTNAPPPYERYRGAGLRWRYFGHACVLVETRDVSVLFDPVLSYTYESQISRYTYLDLPDHIDYVIITHNHQDHILLETLLQIRHKVGRIIVPRGGCGSLHDPSVRLALQQIGFRNVMELGELETLEIDGGTVTGIPFLGEHSDLAISTKLAYSVGVAGQTLLFAADSCNVEPRMYDHVVGTVGAVRSLFLGMESQGAPLSWVYGPLMLSGIDRRMDQSRRLNGCDYEQALAMVQRLGCREVFVYAMGQEPWLGHVMNLKYTEQSKPIVDSNRLLETCGQLGIAAERLFGEREIWLGSDSAVSGDVALPSSTTSWGPHR